MKTYFFNLQKQLDERVDTLSKEDNDPITHLKVAFEVVKKTILTMNEWQQSYVFLDEAEEIDFFKFIRPQFISQYIYYQELYDWESNAPLLEEEQSVYFKEKHRKVKSMLNKLEYVQNYLKAEENRHYSIDSSFEIKTCSSSNKTIDWRPCLQQCLPIAEYMSYKLQIAYLRDKYIALEKPIVVQTEKLSWNRNLIDLYEVLLALYQKKALGGSTTTFKEMVLKVESIVDIQISNSLNKRGRDIAKRKQEPARFLKELAKDVETSVLNTRKVEEDF